MTSEAQEIAKKSKSSFYYAFNLLPPEKREAMNTVYAFCRRTDDIVDENDDPNEIKYQNLRKWRLELERALKQKSEFTFLNNLGRIISQFKIPIDPFFDLIKGMEMDIQSKKYFTAEDLLEYCYYVASTVGLMCIEIFGYKNKSTKDFAVNLGLAMQLTNILRDVKKDSDNNRVYLPEQELINHNYSLNELKQNVYNNNFVSLMSQEAERAKYYFNKATSSLDIEDKPSMFAARAMQHIYQKLLKKLEAEKFNIFESNINVSKFEKAGIAVGVWAKYSLVY
ncbi:MAG: phytoene/squalene synthase family protein [Ignavibacteria bacterium]|jgi:phytoene synthase